MAGRIFAIVGPSGAGKDTLIDAALAADPTLFKVRRVITRPSDAGGEDFEGITEDEFQARQTAGAFVLAWQAHGLWYGIPKTVLDVLAQGQDVIFNGSRGVLTQANDRFDTLIVILITASPKTLAQRLGQRGRETAEQIEKRLERANYELPQGIETRIVMNDASLEDAVGDFIAALRSTGENTQNCHKTETKLG